MVGGGLGSTMKGKIDRKLGGHMGCGAPGKIHPRSESGCLVYKPSSLCSSHVTLGRFL